ncbi:hypothetical protein CI610_03092 [invertebrate metagenome]|uniref:Reverse transcriptase domain-containing protein n=1 Tax=invertebrate metagenome TaxID=1711999 RepID=A0A2H9T456_9ZZZZ
MHQAWECLVEIISKLIDKHIPVHKVNAKHRSNLDQQTRQSMITKSRKWQKYLHCSTQDNWDAYKEARNQTTKNIRTSEYNLERDLVEKIKTDPKLFWKHVRSKTKTKSCIQQNGILTQEDKETANVMVRFFATVFVKDTNNPPPALRNRVVNGLLNSVEITEEKIVKAVNKLKPNKAAGPDNIHPRFIKETINELKESLNLIFNKSFDQSTLPSDWRHAHVTPIYKKGPRNEPGNYRPISLTSVPCKIMQRIIRDSILQHMETNNLFSSHQHGFRQKKSCTTQLLETMDDWAKLLDEGNNIDVIYMDFSKAFDKVCHRLLLHKMEHYGITGKLLKWIAEYLSCHKWYKIGKSTSPKRCPPRKCNRANPLPNIHK